MEVLVRIKRLVIQGAIRYAIYTKGRIDREADQEYFYVLISAKVAT